MQIIQHKSVSQIEVLRGSSTLVLGANNIARTFFQEISISVGKQYDIDSYFPDILYSMDVGPDHFVADENGELLRLLTPPEILLFNTGVEIKRSGYTLIFYEGLSCALTQDFDSQGIIDFDGFDEVTYPSWLREYAMRAETFSRKFRVDVFLSLEWNKPKDLLPRPFWLVFDRIFEIETDDSGEVKVVQLRG